MDFLVLLRLFITADEQFFSFLAGFIIRSTAYDKKVMRPACSLVNDKVARDSE